MLTAPCYFQESSDVDGPPQSFLARHEFVIRRLHSLSGLIPVGAYMIVHLVTNASVLNGPGTFQKNVYTIHSLGSLLPLVEWTFIFIPILFHAIVGVVIVAGMIPNTSDYPYGANRRYTLAALDRPDRVRVHRLPRVPHARLVPLRPLARKGRRALRRSASSNRTTPPRPPAKRCKAAACSCSTRSACWPACSTSPTACGRWASPGASGPVPRAQRRALRVCMSFGVLLALVTVGALYGMYESGNGPGLEKAVEVEDRMYETQNRIRRNRTQRTQTRRPMTEYYV